MHSQAELGSEKLDTCVRRYDDQPLNAVNAPADIPKAFGLRVS
jgi:hypothetical protein